MKKALDITKASLLGIKDERKQRIASLSQLIERLEREREELCQSLSELENNIDKTDKLMDEDMLG